jgi:hypothetical protein
MRNESKSLVNKPQEEDHLEDISEDGKIIYILEKQNMKVWTELI